MLRNDAIEIWKAGVSAVHGRTLVENSLHLANDQLHLQDQTFNLNNFDRILIVGGGKFSHFMACLLYTSPSPRDATLSRMPSSA